MIMIECLWNFKDKVKLRQNISTRGEINAIPADVFKVSQREVLKNYGPLIVLLTKITDATRRTSRTEKFSSACYNTS